jgi:hypothetical protein
MRWFLDLPVSVFILFCVLACSAFAGAPAPKDGKTRAGVVVWDTGNKSATPLSPAALVGKNDWAVIPQDKTADSFQGDVVLSNGQIVAVLRQQEGTVDVHAFKPEGAVARLRLRLQTAGGEPAVRLERVALIENTKGGVCLDATYKTARGEVVAGKFRIKRGDVFVQAEPGTGAGKLRVECPGRFVILPDFFADDMTLDAQKFPLAAVELPSENFVLHPTGDGNALAMCVFENRQQDIKVTLAGAGAHRQATGSEIGFGGKKIWVALLDTPHIWHAHEFKPADAGKIVPLGWKMPFLAQWRVDFSRPDNLTDSWEMLLQEKKNGRYVKPSWLGSRDEKVPKDRERWNTVLGTYPYPCWSDQDRQGYVQPLKSDLVKFAGPALIYPIHRVKQTPVDVYTVVDVMRNTLGVGPCEHILDIEAHHAEFRGEATCGVRDTLDPIYEKKRQKAKRAEIDQMLDKGLTFVKHIRSRINTYVEFGHKTQKYLAEEKKKHPELAETIAEMEKLIQEIDRRWAARVKFMKTPDDVVKMNADFRKNVLDYDGPDALKRCKAYTSALVEIGDNQDELVGECRLVVKTLRQRAGILMALDPRAAALASEIRTRTQEVLRNPADYEKPRH